VITLGNVADSAVQINFGRSAPGHTQPLQRLACFKFHFVSSSCSNGLSCPCLFASFELVKARGNALTLQTKTEPLQKSAGEGATGIERLDQLLMVTTPRSWIALVTIAGLIGAALAWSLIGRISTYVEGRGVFLRENGHIASAAAAGPGTLSQVLVARGSHVTAGQLVAQIESTELEQQVANLRALIAERQSELQRQQGSTQTDLDAKRAALRERSTGLAQVQTDAKRRVDALKERLADEQQLFDAQIVTRSAVLEIRSRLDQAQQDVASAGDRMIQLDLELRDAVVQGEQRVKNAEFSLAEAQRQLRERMETVRITAEVRSPAAGNVEEIQLRAGSLVARGQSVLTLETEGQGLTFIAFTPLREGEQIQPGQEVRISPHWTVREEEGTMLGRVSETSKLPITPDGLRLLLHSEDLVRHFSDAGPVFLVKISLERDPSTASGYAWTSSRGAPVTIDSGSFGEAEVLVKSQRPISLAIPVLRRWTGI
jgi:HlyD family secretion protein